ncbi:bifunctional tRNA (5-methylaminomethyl-2-thiouridine)(34)-methyltransferase MnmD/FAD-dependent 5-carboxymethylaminomethyl-2-thiouridine(34) oxidoreductase MnmC [Alteromonas aestuariivivens]|uniref:tRNA 5-methylaminomethyl-2-thiouridine biosynthesis bifunctional protein MnmC n=1 Tax=Alteromonas aestuariivivens TaxID=1938339 RepID=A0A3D8M4E4_9ALTE|nr:bifunctional tRNA (5-methylaminomethyl-2-thiouridine)(34)-methyltransferase MnmD/FAD-dependent 5-carboxymethylaminomethyl-2-thiouridine(34) oxidoreductase MnmC [Alteromonas aestuariivivens]RDV24617.1 bifunctional tRNA (5-methylaminomethyl-2-thiouridine)(34)-methyltransferase MnmD/FAD-dependent 5-carboxymethylaminomethyl-2-thiouridine(34) oxidoreductase MnmC [Alteromonas aestuariivivens]
MKTPQAQIHFNDQGTPVADLFDDVYFSNDSGINETYHVFMRGNNLPERWAKHSEPSFVIAETGFGTGLNCLVAMLAFKQFRMQHPNHTLKQLYILTTEKFPLPKPDIARALGSFEQLKEASDALLSVYPMAIQGCHRLHMPAFHTCLDLWLGDVHDTLPEWHNPPSGLVDAWFLDGFAPSKNPDMWTDALFGEMARLSKPNGTFSTFTAAGIVKRGMQQAGFCIEKVGGFGRKRDMLIGHYSKNEAKDPINPPYSRYQADAITAKDSVAIIGGGLAGAAIAYALVQKHIRCELFCASNELAQGASGNPQGGFYPQLHAQASHASQIQAHSFLYARRLYDEAVSGEPVPHEFCGVLQLAFSEEVAKRQSNLLQQAVWPAQLVRGVDSAQATELAGITLPYSGLFIEQGGWLSPPQLVQALLKKATQTGLITVHTGTRVNHYEATSEAVAVHFDGQPPKQFAHLVLASGHESAASPALQGLPFRAVRGQVESLPSQPPMDRLSTVLCHKGYLTPAWNGRHALGSTYVKKDLQQEVRVSESEANLNTHQQAMSECDWISALKHDGKARAAIRLGLPDHQPVTGHVHDWSQLRETYAGLGKGKPLEEQAMPPASRVSVLTGLGSRGLTTAPLMGEILASQLTHSPLPLTDTLLQAVSPSRFVIRDCLRNKISDQPE